jgi:archaetidylinositol phosphate synthase
MASVITSCGNPAEAFFPAKRIQRSFVAAAEQRSLKWLAKRTPEHINSDHLTLSGFASQCAVGVYYAVSRFNRHMLLASIIFLALNWLGDSLDGTVARA